MSALGHIASFKVVRNKQGGRDLPWSKEQNSLLSTDRLSQAKQIIHSWEEFSKSPLISLCDYALDLDVLEVLYKDEGSRFGINTFKVLGGAYAVFKYLQTETTRADTSELAANTTFVSATDGNHGRSVAWGCQKAGSSCVIVLPDEVSLGRRKSLELLGAKLILHPGTFDDCVLLASKLAKENGWVEISDTAHNETDPIPSDVMQGYEISSSEVVEQLHRPPTHVFVQAGVGGFAASVTGHFKRTFGSKRPMIIIVEPMTAGCCFQSFQSGRRSRQEGDLETLMGGLACGEVSLFAWEILKDHADAAMVISDDEVAETMKLLALESAHRQPIVAGEAGVASLIGAMNACKCEETRDILKIDTTSRILVYGTEADTDPELYKSLIGV